MSRRDLMVGLLVPLIWGLNFVVIRVGLDSTPPLLLSALRFGVAGAVGIWFVPRPAVPVTTIVIVGVAIGVGQFGLLFVAIDVGMPAGLAGVVIQVQVVFTIGLAYAVLGERPSAAQVTGVSIALAGLIILAIDAAQRLAIVGFSLTIAAALSWALGNLRLRSIDASDALGVVVWSSLVPPAPLVLLVAALDGLSAIPTAISAITVAGAATVGYQSIFATLVAFGAWVRLLAKHEAATVTPLALLVPAVALTSAAALLGEPLTGAALVGTTVVVLGLAIPLLGSRLSER